MKGKLPATVEGILSKIEDAFNDLEKQEKRALSLMRNRDEEMSIRLKNSSDEFGEGTRSLKEVEVIDRLQNDTLKIINDNNKTKLALLQFYSNTVLSEQKDLPVNSEEYGSSGLLDKDMEELRKKYSKT